MSVQEQSIEPQDQGVLERLDSQEASVYWYLAVLACVGGFLFGYDTAVIGSVLAFIPYSLKSFETGYLVGGASIGAAVGALAAGPFTDRFGRKSLLLADAAIYALGAISALTINAAILLSARTLIGLAVGADSPSPRHTSRSSPAAPPRLAHDHAAVDDHGGDPRLLPDGDRRVQDRAAFGVRQGLAHHPRRGRGTGAARARLRPACRSRRDG